MINAMKAVTEKKMTIRGAAKKFNVPYRYRLILVPSHAMSTFSMDYHRLQTKFAKVMFSQASVILFMVGVGSASGGWTDPVGYCGIRSTSGRYASY